MQDKDYLRGGGFYFRAVLNNGPEFLKFFHPSLKVGVFGIDVGIIKVMVVRYFLLNGEIDVVIPQVIGDVLRFFPADVMTYEDFLVLPAHDARAGGEYEVVDREIIRQEFSGGKQCSAGCDDSEDMMVAQLFECIDRGGADVFALRQNGSVQIRNNGFHSGKGLKGE